MVVELIGLPGAGKTYLSDKVSRHKTDVVNLGELSRENLWVKSVLFVIKKYIRVTLKYQKSAKTIFQIIYTKEPLFGEKIKYDDIVDCLLWELLSSKLEKKKRVYLVDEGVAQKITYIAAIYRLTNDEMRTVFTSISHPSKLVYLNTPLDGARDAIRQRNRHVCEMDELDVAALNVYLRSYLNSIEFYLANYEAKIIYRKDSIDYNIKEFVKYIRGDMNQEGD